MSGVTFKLTQKIDLAPDCQALAHLTNQMSFLST